MATFGNASVGGYTNNGFANQIFVAQFAPPGPGTLTDVYAYIDNLSTGHVACNLRGVVYGDSSGIPYTLLGTATPNAITASQAAGWVDGNFGAGVPITGGTSYWLGFGGDANAGGINQYYSALTGGLENDNSSAYGSGPPNPYSGSEGTTTRILCVYATYTPTPVVTSLSVTSGPVAGGTSTVITGSGFTAATAVHFGSANAPTYTVNNDTTITVTSPPGIG